MRLTGICALIFGMAAVGTGCSTNETGSTQLKDYNQMADHDCSVVLTQVQYSPSPAQYSFTVVAKNGDAAYVHYKTQESGNQWRELHLEKGAQGFVGSLPIQYPNHSMWAEVVAYVVTRDGLLYDHNFESGDMGTISLSSSNNWNFRASNCQ